MLTGPAGLAVASLLGQQQIGPIEAGWVLAPRMKMVTAAFPPTLSAS
jgi:hypothetical protein